eukprot:gene16567-22797_t
MRTMVVGGKKNAAEGVSLKFLREFAAKVDGEMSTVQVVAQYIMPVTKGKLPKKFVATMNAAQLGAPTTLHSIAGVGRFAFHTSSS